MLGPVTLRAGRAELSGTDRQTALAAMLLLATLRDAHLLIERQPGRFVYHDLLRVHATELAGAEDTAAGREAALTRSAAAYEGMPEQRVESLAALHTCLRGSGAAAVRQEALLLLETAHYPDLERLMSQLAPATT